MHGRWCDNHMVDCDARKIHAYILIRIILNEFQGCLNMSYMQSIGYATLAKLDPQYGLCKWYNYLIGFYNYYQISAEFIWGWIIFISPWLLVLSDTSVVPPLIYAIMGTSREIAIGPVAVVSLLIPSMLQKLQDPAADPIAYTKLVLTATFFTGIFQAAFGILR